MLSDIRRKNKFISIIYGLRIGFYHINRCPVCGHLYLGENSICGECGYDAFSDAFDVPRLKEEYKLKKNEN